MARSPDLRALALVPLLIACGGAPAPASSATGGPTTILLAPIPGPCRAAQITGIAHVNGTPIAGVTIADPDAGTSTISAEDGRFVLVPGAPVLRLSAYWDEQTVDVKLADTPGCGTDLEIEIPGE
jgi:hypothetical protein